MELWRGHRGHRKYRGTARGEPALKEIAEVVKLIEKTVYSMVYRGEFATLKFHGQRRAWEEAFNARAREQSDRTT